MDHVLSDPRILTKLHNASSVLDMRLRLNADDAAAVAELCQWSDAALAVCARIDLVGWLSRLSPEERQAFTQLLEWPAKTLNKLRTQPEHSLALSRMWNRVNDREDFMRLYFQIASSPDAATVNVRDAFSQGQIDSKMWLIETLRRLKIPLRRIFICCGWIGLLPYLMQQNADKLSFESIRSFDIDPLCAPLADMLNGAMVRDSWRFKASTMDVMELDYDGVMYATLKKDGSTEMVCDTADTVINCGCEHLPDLDRWISRIPRGKLVILQSSDHEGYEGHVNHSLSLFELVRRAGLSRVMFKGKLELEQYTRYMVIGKR